MTILQDGNPAHAYLRAHGVDLDYAIAAGVRYADGAICVPMTDGTGRPTGHWARRRVPRGTWRSDPGSGGSIYVAPTVDLRTAQLIVIAEGPISALALAQRGYAAVASIGVGWGLIRRGQRTADGRRGPRMLHPGLVAGMGGADAMRGRRVVILPDRDYHEGHAHVRHGVGALAQLLRAAGAIVRIAEQPACGCGCGDICDLLGRHPDADHDLAHIIEGARLVVAGHRLGVPREVCATERVIDLDRGMQLQLGAVEIWGDTIYDRGARAQASGDDRLMVCRGTAQIYRDEAGHESASPRACRTPGCPCCRDVARMQLDAALQRLARTARGAELDLVTVRVEATHRGPGDAVDVVAAREQDRGIAQALRALGDLGVAIGSWRRSQVGALHEPAYATEAIIAIERQAGGAVTAAERTIRAAVPGAAVVEVRRLGPVRDTIPTALRAARPVFWGLSPHLSVEDYVATRDALTRAPMAVRGVLHGRALGLMSIDPAVQLADLAQVGDVPEPPPSRRRCPCGCEFTLDAGTEPTTSLVAAGWCRGRIRSNGEWLTPRQLLASIGVERLGAEIAAVLRASTTAAIGASP